MLHNVKVKSALKKIISYIDQKRFCSIFIILLLLCSNLIVSAKEKKQYANTPLLKEYADHVVLDNGIVTVNILKANAHITSYRYKGYEMLRDGYYSMDGGTAYSQPSHCDFSVKSQSDDRVDISLKSKWQASYRRQAFDIDVHYVLERTSSGVYSYAILDHPANYPQTRVGEWRMVWKLDQDMFNRIMVDSLRNMEMPTSADMAKAERTSIPEAVKLTTGVKAGKYECKYEYSASYYDIGTYGHASGQRKIGAWMVLGGYDFFNDGPVAADLNAAHGINHLHFGRDHYGGSGTSVNDGEKWSKIFGPFLLYVNSKNSEEEMWADAKQKVIEEKNKWPYKWLTDFPEYPSTKERGSASGNFNLHDPLKPLLHATNTWIGLTDPAADWQNDSKHYQYWVKADAKGNFTIPNIRPGTYTLHAFTNGAVGEYSRENIEVRASEKIDLKNIVWQIPRNKGKLIWEIGIPDRSAAEYKYGDQYWNAFFWETYSKGLPNPIIYDAAKADWHNELNYVHSSYLNADGHFVAWPWKINFNISSLADTGSATLTFAIASAQGARVDIYVNDSTSVFTSFTPSMQGGNALVREGIKAKYTINTISIPVSKLKKGANTITLVQGRFGNRPDHIMYDYISLEAPEK